MTTDDEEIPLARAVDSITLSDEQQECIERVEEFIADPGRGAFFVMQGLAGTGKTTVLAKIARKHPGCIVVTLTGKAASVLSRKTGAEVSTIHSAIYKLREEKLLPSKKLDLSWDFVKDSTFVDRVLLLDESSMVGDDIARDLLATGARVVACGDPGQLPPVKGNPFFTRPDFVLQHVHRQALDSPIIRQAHNVRHGWDYQSDGPNFRVTPYVSREEILQADAIICWKNTTRLQLNHLKRAHLGWAHKPPQAGEPVMCLRNDRELGIFNGAVYVLAEDYVPRSNRIRIIADGSDITINGTFFEGVDDEGRTWTRDVTPFAYGYAATCHKFQGSEAPSVIVVDEYTSNEGRAAWLYTAFTRAQERVQVQAWR